MGRRFGRDKAGMVVLRWLPLGRGGFDIEVTGGTPVPLCMPLCLLGEVTGRMPVPLCVLRWGDGEWGRGGDGLLAFFDAA